MGSEAYDEYRKKLHGMGGLAAGAVRAAVEEMARGNVAFGRGLVGAIEDLPDTDAVLLEMARKLEELAG